MNKYSISYKKKIRYLLFGTVLFVLLIYVLVLSKTVYLYQANNALKQKLVDAETAPERKVMLKKKLEKLTLSLSAYISDSVKNREYILDLVSDFSHKNHITLKEFQPSVLSVEKDFDIETNVIIAEGNYINLLKLVYEIEQINKAARPVSVNFQKYFDYKRKSEVLSLKLYLQNIRVKSNEVNS